MREQLINCIKEYLDKLSDDDLNIIYRIVVRFYHR